MAGTASGEYPTTARLSFAGTITLDGVVRAELNVATPLSIHHRNRKAILGLVDGRHRVTGL